ncbi:uncharacterized protein LOC133201253 [Saccostrea echinata]|uniref:uncharacterized protein LOC133201253 n=1 Tax=Saccostrea echinata TaxID=191078 RepID=UPI002A8007AC|nr:uncharacterized protein LOC133201253 [Saccostrea echinata]
MIFHVAVFTSWLFSLCLVTAGVGKDEKFYDCDVFSNEDSTPKKNAYCFKDMNDDNFYCKTWTCQSPPCSPDLQRTQMGDSCPICDGTCTVEGRIISVGKTVACADGVNRCWCIGTGVVISTRMLTNKYALCGVDDNNS